MHAQIATILRVPPPGQSRLSAARAVQREEAGPRREQSWRQAEASSGDPADAVILASRWIDERTTARRMFSLGTSERYIVAVALRAVQARIGRIPSPVFDGIVPAGMVHVTEPGQDIEAEFFAPCDFVHFHVAAAYVRDRHPAAAAGTDGRGLRNLIVRDELAVQLSRSLTHGPDGDDPMYIESIGKTILIRALASRPAPSRVGALPKWRLRRVQEHLAANLAEPIRLADLAGVAGLSRMHFAAQFRVATGSRPHDFVLEHRIESAKQMLAETDTPLVEVALSVGFQTQSHFSTVFKRLVGETPARWQRARHVT